MRWKQKFLKLQMAGDKFDKQKEEKALMKKAKPIKKRKLVKRNRERGRSADDQRSSTTHESRSNTDPQLFHSNLGRQLDHRTRRGMLANSKNMLDATKALLGNQSNRNAPSKDQVYYYHGNILE